MDKNTAAGRITKVRDKSDMLILAAALAAIILSFVIVRKDGHLCLPTGNGFNLPETCIIKSVTGIMCPTCGLTRGFSAISHGELRMALAYNPGSIAAYIYVLFQIPYRALRLFRSRSRTALSILKKIHIYFTMVTAAFLLISWILYLIHELN